MAPILIEAVFSHKSGLLEEAFVNTWCFLTPTAAYDETEAFLASSDLHNFYCLAPPPFTDPICDYWANCVSRTGTPVTHRIYDLTGHLDGSPHGSPKNLVHYAVPAELPGIGLPSEVSITLSFNAAYAADPEFGPDDPVTGNPTRPRARLRGRTYLGPWLNTVVSENAPADRIGVQASMRNRIRDSAIRLRDAPGHAWAVWSRKAAEVNPVVGGWIDDAFDTQRRRGEAATVRSQF